MGGDHEPFSGDFDGDGSRRSLLVRPGRGAGPPLVRQRRRLHADDVDVALDADPLVGDLNGDDRSDIIWFRSGQAAHPVWTGKRSTGLPGYSVAMDRPYALPAVGDFDGDLQDDVFWHASPTDGNRVWNY